MDTQSLTLERIDALLAYLPPLSVPGRTYFDQAASTGSYPVYADDVFAFYMEAGRPWWSDYGYQPNEAYAMLCDEERVRGCTMEEFKTMLTYCVRSERFGDGSWLGLLESGAIHRLLHRLGELRRDLE